LIFSEPKNESKKIVYEKNPQLEEEILAQNEWTGEFLKKVREYKNYSIEKLSEITKVNGFYIKAIELDNSKNLPAPVFVRGYVIQIAKELGLDAKKVADSYMKNFNSK